MITHHSNFSEPCFPVFISLFIQRSVIMPLYNFAKVYYGINTCYLLSWVLFDKSFSRRYVVKDFKLKLRNYII